MAKKCKKLQWYETFPYNSPFVHLVPRKCVAWYQYGKHRQSKQTSMPVQWIQFELACMAAYCFYRRHRFNLSLLTFVFDYILETAARTHSILFLSINLTHTRCTTHMISIHLWFLLSLPSVWPHSRIQPFVEEQKICILQITQHFYQQQ